MENKSKSKIFSDSENSHIAAKIYYDMSINYKDISSGDHYKAKLWLESKLLKYIGQSPKVLDLGCATGTTGEILKKNSIQAKYLHGADVSPKMIELCEKDKNYDFLQVLNVAQDLNKISQNNFDVVVAVGIMEFIKDCDQVLSDLSNLTASNCDLYITFENSSSELIQEYNTKHGQFKKIARSREDVLSHISNSRFIVQTIETGAGYFSPSLSKEIEYLYCHLVKKR